MPFHCAHEQYGFINFKHFPETVIFSMQTEVVRANNTDRILNIALKIHFWLVCYGQDVSPENFTEVTENCFQINKKSFMACILQWEFPVWTRFVLHYIYKISRLSEGELLWMGVMPFQKRTNFQWRKTYEYIVQTFRVRILPWNGQILISAPGKEYFLPSCFQSGHHNTRRFTYVPEFAAQSKEQ